MTLPLMLGGCPEALDRLLCLDARADRLDRGVEEPVDEEPAASLELA
jgi:hypothetical protein